MRKLIFLLIVIQFSLKSFSQDTLRKISGEFYIVTVTEVSDENVKYKKYSNLEGPIYVVSKNEIEYIHYKNGEIETYNKKKPNLNSENTEDLFVLLTKKGNKVYVDSKNRNAIIHARSELQIWGYWIIVDRKEDADFILNFNIRFGGLGDAFGNANFVDPKTNKILKSTKQENTITSWDINPKRGVIIRIIDRDIKTLFN